MRKFEKRILTLFKICEICSSMIERPYKMTLDNWNKRRFCSQKCSGVWKVDKDFCKFFKGKKLSKEHRDKVGIHAIGKHYALGYRHTEDAKARMAKKKSGVLHWNWKGGISPLRKLVQKLDLYINWRIICFKRDYYTCQICGQKGGKLIIDHIKPYSQIIFDNNITTVQQVIDCDELWDISNGRTLCELCHRKTDTYAGRANVIKKVLTTI